MGIIRAIGGAVGGGLADQWLEVIEPGNMSDTTVFVEGVQMHRGSKRNANRKGTDGIISSGSVIHVPENTFMLLIDGGKVVDYSAEAGYYQVDDNAVPSMFNGQFGASLKETFARIKFGGIPSAKQKVFYLNLQEIKGIKFGTRTPINYFDNFYNAELFLRAHGSYSIKITEPLKFYGEVVPKNVARVDITQINEQYLNEFLDALQSAINQMSADGVRISHVASKGRELSKYMAETLDEDWTQMRGMEVRAVGIASISYDEESQKLINMRNQGAMLGDPTVREGYVQGAMARSMESAASNTAGAVHGFVGLGQASRSGGDMASVLSSSNQAQIERNELNQKAEETLRRAEEILREAEQKVNGTAGESGVEGTHSSVSVSVNGEKVMESSQQAEKSIAAGTWTCGCGNVNGDSNKFCPECGKKRAEERKCNHCGFMPPEGQNPNFCPECGTPFGK